MTGLKKIIITTLLAYMLLESIAQRADLTFDHYNVEDGLSQSTVWNIFEDSKGFVWFCTPDGLNKFDGYSFTVYRNIKGDTNSIASNHPIIIFEDTAGEKQNTKEETTLTARSYRDVSLWPCPFVFQLSLKDL